MFCLREPSLGPYFGIKGGGTGGGRAQVVPAEDINLHFVGDMYAVEKANNLLCAMVDNHLQHGNELGLDPRRIVLRRVIDLNERSLRDIIIGLGGPQARRAAARRLQHHARLRSHGHPLPREGFRRSRPSAWPAWLSVSPTRANRSAPMPCRPWARCRCCCATPFIRTWCSRSEGTPAFVHGGPFANIAQGTNTCVATRLALKLADYVVTEAGFATDLGAEKFFHIKCRIAGLNPAAAVIVATTKAIAYHGGFTDTGGLGNLAKHIENIRLFGLDPVVCISHFPG